MLKSYVLRMGRFTDAQKKAYKTLAEKYIIPFSEKSLNLEKVFGNCCGVTVEIGFGMGGATAALAETNPDKNYLGIEVHRPGVGKLLWEVENRLIQNIRIIEYDAIHVMQKMIPPGSLEAIHIFFPDPWPKKKHHKRRLVQSPFTSVLANTLKPGGYLYMVTDWEDYALFALEELNAVTELYNSCEGFSPAQVWRPQTKFEKKGLSKDHKIRELLFLKRESL